jgi:hypothetical protein
MPEEEEEERGMGQLYSTVECHSKMEGKTVVYFDFLSFSFISQ